MPLDGSDVASPPAGTTAVPNTPIESAKYNAFVSDVYSILNTVRSIAKGFTGASTAVGAHDNFSTKGTDIASAATCDIGAATGQYVHITGTTTITAFGTKTAGVVRRLTFDGALTLTHNGTSLILPGAANITTAAGDVAVMVSEGSGNWRCLAYQRASVAPINFVVTPWVAYTPTFTGFGTPSSVNFISRRVGDTLEVMGRFTFGTTTATEARVSFGFNGVDGGITSKVPTRMVCGVGVRAASGAVSFYTHTAASTGYFTFGLQSSGAHALQLLNGDQVGSSGQDFYFHASVPITGW